MRKRILPLLAFAILCAALLCPIRIHAATPLDPEAQASLTLHYRKDGVAFADLQIRAYRVAEAFPDGSYALIEPFASYPVHIHDITEQTQWQQVAQTLYAYIVADGITPNREAATDEAGTVRFSDLKTGLYFVEEVVAENAGGTYIFNQFLVYVPTPQPDGSYQYAVEAAPKCRSFIPNTQYTVTKLWQDAGNQNLRPREVTVDIYKDGTLLESQVLSAENNWTYTWQVSGTDHGKWTVAERSVAEPYKVTLRQNGSHFSIINTCQLPSDIPQTGDRFAPMPFILAMCLSGIALLTLSIHSRRRK